MPFASRKNAACGCLLAVLAAGLAGCTAIPGRVTHALRPLVGHRYPTYPVGSVAFERAVDAYTRSEAWPDHRVALLADPRENDAARAAMIDAARRRLCLEMDVGPSGPAHDGEWTRLRAAVERGVAVRLLLDARPGPQGEHPGLDALVAAGAEVRWWNPDRATRMRVRLDNRSARHTLVMDGLYALIGDDPALLVGGPAVAEAEKSFAEMWARAGELIWARLVPTAYMRAVRRAIHPSMFMNQSILPLPHKTFNAPDYFMPDFEDERFDRVVAAALRARFAGETERTDADAADADAFAAVLHAGSGLPLPAKPTPADDNRNGAPPSVPAVDPLAAARAHIDRLAAAWADNALFAADAEAPSAPAPPPPMLPAWPDGAVREPAPAEDRDDPDDAESRDAADREADPEDPEAPAPEPDDPDLADWARMLPGAAKRALFSRIGTASVGIGMALHPGAMLAGTTVDIGIGLVRERRRRYVVRDEDVRPRPPSGLASGTASGGASGTEFSRYPPATDSGTVDPEPTRADAASADGLSPADTRAARWARYARENMGLGPAPATVRIVSARPDERTSATLDLALLGLHAAQTSTVLSLDRSRRRPRGLNRAVAAAEKRGVSVREPPSPAAPAAAGWMTVDGRWTYADDARWNRRDFFLAYALAVEVDDPALAAAVERRIAEGRRAP